MLGPSLCSLSEFKAASDLQSPSALITHTQPARMGGARKSPACSAEEQSPEASSVKEQSPECVAAVEVTSGG